MNSPDPLAPRAPAREPAVSSTDGRPSRWIIVIAVLSAVVLVIVGTATGLGFAAMRASETPPTSVPSRATEETPKPTPTPTDADPSLPADCASMLAAVLAEDRWRLEYERLASVPGGEGLSSDEDRFVLTPFAFDLLAHVMTLSERLTCATVDEETVTTVTTWITEVDGPQSEDLAQTFDSATAAYSCSDWREGRLCDIVWETEGGEIREQHFMRDGLWIATVQSSAWYGDQFDDSYVGAVVDGVFGQEG